jgi:hypothetical protein
MCWIRVLPEADMREMVGPGIERAMEAIVTAGKQIGIIQGVARPAGFGFTIVPGMGSWSVGGGEY